MAGFEVTPYGLFCLTPEAGNRQMAKIVAVHGICQQFKGDAIIHRDGGQRSSRPSRVPFGED
jgi:hypothetical protein